MRLPTDMLFILSSWFIVWCVFLLTERTPRGGTKLPRNGELVIYSSLIFPLSCVFYTISFWRITGIAYTNPSWLQMIAFGSVLSGMLLMSLSRWHLRSLSLDEAMFSLNPETTSEGLYRYCKHPMYLGITFLLTGSLILYPTILGILIFAGIELLLLKKARLETK